MKVTPFIIEKFAKFIVGGVPFETLKTLVSIASATEHPGEVKRQQVMDALSAFGYSLSTFLINLGIELAVAWLKSREGRL